MHKLSLEFEIDKKYYQQKILIFVNQSIVFFTQVNLEFIFRKNFTFPFVALCYSIVNRILYSRRNKYRDIRASSCNLKTASGFDYPQKRYSHEFAARNYYVEIIKIVGGIKETTLWRLHPSYSLCIRGNLVDFLVATSDLLFLSRLRLGRNRRNVPETGSNEDSTTTTFVHTTDPLRACSIYWVYLYALPLSLCFSLFLM